MFETSDTVGESRKVQLPSASVRGEIGVVMICSDPSGDCIEGMIAKSAFWVENLIVFQLKAYLRSVGTLRARWWLC